MRAFAAASLVVEGSAIVCCWAGICCVDVLICVKGGEGCEVGRDSARC